VLKNSEEALPARAPEGSAPTGRWRLLETIREYALEKLTESGETEQVARHCAHA
jgi:predicted ATPase